MSGRVGSRALAVSSLAAGFAAAAAAVVSALGAPSAQVSQEGAAAPASSSRVVPFGVGRVSVRTQATGLTCFTVRGGSTPARSCVRSVGSHDIGYASSAGAIGGVAGVDVRAVIVRLTKKGTVWATLRHGAFFARVPAGYDVRAVVKVLRDGTRKTFAAS
jgi:hypothetical protein